MLAHILCPTAMHFDAHIAANYGSVTRPSQSFRHARRESAAGGGAARRQAGRQRLRRRRREARHFLWNTGVPSWLHLASNMVMFIPRFFRLTRNCGNHMEIAESFGRGSANIGDAAKMICSQLTFLLATRLLDLSVLSRDVAPADKKYPSVPEEHCGSGSVP